MHGQLITLWTVMLAVLAAISCPPLLLLMNGCHFAMLSLCQSVFGAHAGIP